MSDKKFNIQLEGVPQTLLMPLLGRAEFSRESYSPIHDKLAIKLVESINYDFKNLSQHVGRSTAFWMARAFHFDEAIKKYLKLNPRAVIVNLGAGLETAFYRIDNKELTWIDLDLPEVITLREKMLPPSERAHAIAKSILDYSWMEDIKQYGDEFFFFAGGLFMYFTEADVKALLTEMANRFPKSELIFDNVSSKGIYYANEMLKKSKMTNALLQWGMDDSKQLETWSPHIKIIDSIPYFKGIKTMKGFPFKRRMKMFFYDLVNKAAIIHLRFC